LRRRRDRYAHVAEAHEFLLERVAEDLVERLSIVTRDFPVALNLGAQHGLLSRRIAELGNVHYVIDADASLKLLERAPGPRVLADEEALPAASLSDDLQPATVKASIETAARLAIFALFFMDKSPLVWNQPLMAPTKTPLLKCFWKNG